MTADTWAAHLDHARDLHRRLPVFLGYVDYDDEALVPDGGTYIDLAKLQAAGVHTLVASIGFGCYFQTGPRDYHLAGPAYLGAGAPATPHRARGERGAPLPGGPPHRAAQRPGCASHR